MRNDMRHNMLRNFWGALGGVWALILMSTLPAYITHIFWTITTLSSATAATGGQIFMAFFGLIIPPLGALHGWILWF